MASQRSCDRGTETSIACSSLSDFSHRLFSRAAQNALGMDTVYEQLKSALLSHSRLLRLSTLRLLGSPIVRASEGTIELVKKALQAEEISVDVQGVRERVLRIGRVGQVVGDTQGAELCARWLIGMLNVS